MSCFSISIAFNAAGDLSLFPLEEGNPFRRGSGGVQCVDLVGTDGQWQAADPEQEVFDRRASYSVSMLIHYIII